MNSPNLQPLIIAVLSSGTITALVSWLISRRKNHAETDGIVADTYSHILIDMRAELKRYQDMLTAANRRIYILELREMRQERRVRQLERALWDAQIPIPEEQPWGKEDPHPQLDLWGDLEEGEDPSDEDPTD